MACVVVVSLAVPVARAQVVDEVPSAAEPPAYRKLRYDEDYSYLFDPSRRIDAFDGLKYVPLGGGADTYLSLGGEVRWRYEQFEKERWNPQNVDHDGSLLQRYLLHGDLHVGDGFRAFAQLQSGLEDGRPGGPRGPDEDKLDWHQLFVDFRGTLGSDEVTLRAGRQELLYGAQRLVSVRDLPNVRRAFDAARVLVQSHSTQVDFFAGRPVEVDPGTFDDDPIESEALWGIYVTTPAPFAAGTSLDVYYLGYQRDDAQFVQGFGDERRHSLGSRWSGKRAAWDFDFEAVTQFGSFDGGDIRAWTTSADAGYTLDHTKLAPRLGLRTEIISGDRDAADSDLETFNAMYPRGAYFGEMALVGPANLIDVHPSVDVNLSSSVELSLDCDIFWRETTDDGIYSANGSILRSDVGDARFIGTQPGVGLDWQLDRHSTFHAAYSHFFPGAFIDESGSSSEVDFVTVSFQFRF